MSVAGLLAYLTAPRTVLAVVVSATVTGTVVGPLGYQAVQARDAAAEQPADGGPAGPTGGRDRTTTTALDDPTTTTTSSTTTTPPTSTTAGGPPEQGPSTSRPSAGPTVPAAPPVILVSVTPDPDDASPIEGTEVSGEVWVFVAGGSGVAGWEVDGRDVDLVGDPLDTTELAPGVHRIEVEVQTPTGRVVEEAVFEVVR